MATLTYDPSNDPEFMSSEETRDQESLAIGEKLAQEQQNLLAGKYKDAEELEKAYIELQKKLGAGDKNTDSTEEQAEPEASEEEGVDDPQVTAIMQAAEEFDSKGELSEETLKSFEQMSSRELVDAYFRYQNNLPEASDSEPQAVELSDQQVNQIQNAVGGEAAYRQLVGWAAENFSPDEIQAFDSVIDSGNMGAIKLALQALSYRYQDAMGYEGNMIQGKAARSTDVFRSQAEVVRAMQDPRYDNDPAYRQDVFMKLERSDLNF